MVNRHGLSTTLEYKRWRAMMNRCYRPTWTAYPWYGGRGIKVCQRWHDFDLFLLDTGPVPAGKTIDRIDHDGDYAPDNWRWASKREQSRNTRANRFVECRGERLTVGDWAEKAGIGVASLLWRLNSGWSPEKALFTPKIEPTGRPHGLRFPNGYSK